MICIVIGIGYGLAWVTYRGTSESIFLILSASVLLWIVRFILSRAIKKDPYKFYSDMEF